MNYPREADRVTVISCRNIGYVRSRSLLYSFEDFAQEAGLAAILSPPAPYFNKIHSRIVRHIHRISPEIAGNLVGQRQPRRIVGDIRLISCQSLSELPLLLPYFEKRSEGQQLACLMEEVWAHDIPHSPMAIQLLKRCDAIFVGCAGGVAAVAEATGKPSFHIPPSVDAMACNPFACMPKPRAIDLYYMGRRQTELHAGLQRWAAAAGHFYLYDTAGNAVMTNHREHRQHLADLIQRSRFFIVAPGKSSGVDGLTSPQDEVGSRYYEGAACGAILLGTANHSPILQQNFAYDNAVIPFDGSSEQLIERMESLSQDDLATEKIRREGVANILRRHDFAHRWKLILQALGQPEPTSLSRKLAQLDQAADEVLIPTQRDAAGAERFSYT